MSMEVLMVVGFLLGAYSIVGNDAIQTLGTFLSSNSHRPWWVLWLFAGGILAVVLVYGWVVYAGDVSYGRLQTIAVPEHFSWIYCVPAFVLLLLTRGGIPVSTTFLTLTVFAPKALPSMVIKSLAGYATAFVVAIFIYKLVTRGIESRFRQTDGPTNPWWVVAQWCSTGFLWSQWLIQDLANIYVFLPRDPVTRIPELAVGWLIASIVAMLAMQAIIFYTHGGAIQKVVLTKTNTTDIRSATFVDLIYGIVLFLFKEVSKLPMSTTWVFVGLLAGREIAITWNEKHRSRREVSRLVLSDFAKITFGLIVSVAVAYLLPFLHEISHPH
jgi:phosphate/sulfate permease